MMESLPELQPLPALPDMMTGLKALPPTKAKEKKKGKAPKRKPGKQFSPLRYRIIGSLETGKVVFQKPLSETPFKPDRVSSWHSQK